MKLQSLLLGVALVGLTAFSALAAKLGDPAAPLKIKDWVKGKAVDVKDGKSVYVVEFWATWCGPCKVSIPHLTEMQTKFKDKGVVFIGISDEPLATVKPFVEKMAAKMDYTVACDDERKSNEGYMQAYGRGGIPSAFVVSKEGKVVWAGHPMDGLESILEQVIEGKYDLTAAAKKDEARAALDEYTQLSSAGDEKAPALGRKVLAGSGDDVEKLVSFAFGIAANARNKNRDFALAEEALDRAEKTTGGKDSRILGTRAVVRFESGKEEEGLKLAKEAVESCNNSKDKPRYENYVRVMESRLKAKAKPAETKEPKAKE